MRRLVLTTAIMLGTQVFQVVRADSSLTLPWDEFKTLYTEKIQQQFELGKKKEIPETIISIDEAHYKVSIDGSEALVDVLIKGKQLQGKPEPLPLFDHNVAISQINNVEGGAIISNESGYLFYIDSSTENKTFQVNLTLVVSLLEDRQSQKLSFNIPTAVRNVLDVELPLETDLIEHPGIQQSLQRYYFSPDEQLTLRFADSTKRDQQIVDVDTFTQIELEGDKYVFTFNCVPDHFSKQNIELGFQPPLRYLDSSLPTSRLKSSGTDKLIINTGQNETSPFIIRFEVDAKENLADLHLPVLLENIGQQGSFQVLEPVEAQISLTGNKIKRDLSYSRLPVSIKQNVNVTGHYQTIEKSESFNLKLKRFDAVEAPQIVLNELFFYTSFAENGNEISVIRMELPKQAGDRLVLNPIPNTEIWSLQVNGKKKEVFTQMNDDQETIWVIPLEENESSIVELTYIQNHKKLGLEGRLSIIVPETGLAAQKVFVSVGLTDRVELVAVEGDLTPAETSQCPVVKSFTGKPYVFQYPFYRGKALEAAIFYKEPLEVSNLESSVIEGGS